MRCGSGSLAVNSGDHICQQLDRLRHRYVWCSLCESINWKTDTIFRFAFCTARFLKISERNLLGYHLCTVYYVICIGQLSQLFAVENSLRSPEWKSIESAFDSNLDGDHPYVTHSTYSPTKNYMNSIQCANKTIPSVRIRACSCSLAPCGLNTWLWIYVII